MVESSAICQVFTVWYPPIWIRWIIAIRWYELVCHWEAAMPMPCMYSTYFTPSISISSNCPPTWLNARFIVLSTLLALHFLHLLLWRLMRDFKVISRPLRFTSLLWGTLKSIFTLLDLNTGLHSSGRRDEHSFSAHGHRLYEKLIDFILRAAVSKFKR